jgi:hypothetical protein
MRLFIIARALHGEPTRGNTVANFVARAAGAFFPYEVMAASIVPLGMALCAPSRSELFARRGSAEVGHENARKVFAKVQA